MVQTIERRMAKRALLALAVAALATMATFLPRPDAAHAGTANCPYYNFCLWEHVSFDGGRYNYSGSDTNLWNDHWVGGSGGIVAKQASSLQNNGAPAVYQNVRLYWAYGDLGCVPRGAAWGDLTHAPYWGPYVWNINDYIEGYRWVSGC
jgi:hypothetical protein